MRARHHVRLGVERLETRDTPSHIWALGGGRANVSLQATDTGVYRLVTPGHSSVIQPDDPRLPALLGAAGISPADVPDFTTTTVTASVGTPTYGQSVSFTATVLPTGPPKGPPEGTVQFFIDGNSFGAPVTLSGGTASSAPLSTLAAGTHVITAAYTNTSGSFFDSTSAGLNTTVAKAVLTVTADDATRAYGDPNPAFTATITGFQNGETLAGSGVTGAPALGTTATAASPVGAYAITAGPGTLAAGNYSFAFVNGTLTVTGPVVVTGTGGDDTLVVARTPGGGPGSITYVLDGGAPVSIAGVTSFTFDGLGGNDSLTVSLAGGLLLRSGAISFDGGAGLNTLTIDAAGLPVRTTPGAFNVGGQAVCYTGVAATNLNNAAGVNASAGPDTADRATAFAGLTAQERAVQALYLDALGRAGSKAELDGWAAVLPPGATSLSQAVVSGIENSLEAHDHLVRSWYLSYLGRPANGTEEQGFVDLLGAGQSEEQTLSLLLGSAEFYNRAQTLAPAGTADERFVQALCGVLLNRPGSPGEVAGWVNALPALGQQGVALLFLQSAEFRAIQIEGYYDALLHRPSVPAEVDALVSSPLDVRAVRLLVETGTEFFFNG